MQAFQSLREARKGASGAVTAFEGLKTTLGIFKGSFKASFGAGADSSGDKFAFGRSFKVLLQRALDSELCGLWEFRVGSPLP